MQIYLASLIVNQDFGKLRSMIIQFHGLFSVVLEGRIAFSCPREHFKWIVMPFGLKNTPSTF